MALTLTEKMRWTAGGKQFRNFEIVQSDGTPLSVTAASMDMQYIEAIIGCTTRMSIHVALSLIIDAVPSISSDHKSVQWTSAGTNMLTNLTIGGW